MSESLNWAKPDVREVRHFINGASAKAGREVIVLCTLNVYSHSVVHNTINQLPALAGSGSITI
ncbi:hypothetical protein [Paenibacillus sp. FSL R10-2736]|uniref:hypothetical protein n=1 Tax=Paenibacillus sp. FSL R10-2736 TaxID=2954692 RepID=UPI0030F840B0